VIERIKRMNLEGNPMPSQSEEKLGLSQKGPPKWFINTLEIFHPYEVGKSGTKISPRQDGGDVDNSYLGYVHGMDVSYYYELNLSTNFEQTSFEEVSSHDEWKESMYKKYDSLVKNGTWKLVDPPFGTKAIACKRISKNEYKLYGSLYNHKVMLMEKDFHRNKGLIMRRIPSTPHPPPPPPAPPQQNGIPFLLYFPW
jgi:hypothetical protein